MCACAATATTRAAAMFTGSLSCSRGLECNLKAIAAAPAHVPMRLQGPTVAPAIR